MAQRNARLAIALLDPPLLETCRMDDHYRPLFEKNPLPMWVVDLETYRFLAVNDAAVRHYGYSREEFMTMSAKDVRPPADVPALLDAVAEAARRWPAPVGGARATWRHRKRSGELIDVEIRWSPVSFEGRRASLALITDTTESKHTEERLRRQARFVQVLQDVAVAANQATSVDEALQFCLDRVCEHTGWPVGHVYLVDPETHDHLQPTKLWHLSDAERFAPFRAITEATPLSIGEGLPGEVLRSGRALWIEDVTRAANFPRAPRARECGLRAALGLPVLVGSTVVGVLEFFLTEARQPDEEMLHVLGHTGAQIGRVMERQRADTELRKSRELFRTLAGRVQSVREEEQSRIARQVHDELGQRLTAMRLDLSWLARRLDGESEAARHRVDQMIEGVDATLDVVREITAELRPAMLEDLGLPAAIEWLTQRFARQSGIAATFESRLPDASVDRDRALAAFRIVQEALTNVARHARATRVTVTGEAADGELRLEVLDDGRGIAAQDLAKPRALGLVGMRERANAYGGTVSIVPSPGRGTRVLVRIPLPDPRGATAFP
ncbi:MAG TPA: GAF domain-containing protein [Candidatus Limnocylindria bacterium]|nr:GAF domain-containing protein [Candidatus Limnocylindria bacterium]